MTNTNPGNLPEPRPPLISGDIFGNIPQLVYLLYLVSFILHPCWLVGVIVAYVNRGDAEPVARSHYDFQIATFWRGFVIALIGLVLLFAFLIGTAVFLFLAIWLVIRCIKGLQRLSRGEPMPTNIGWGFG